MEALVRFRNSFYLSLAMLPALGTVFMVYNAPKEPGRPGLATRGANAVAETVEFRSYYPNKQLREIRYFRNERKTGDYTAWWENGQKKLECHFGDDEYEGVFREWNRNGLLLKEMHYKAGHEEGEQRMWYENGKIKANYLIKDGRRYGLLGTKNCDNAAEDVPMAAGLPYYNTPDFTPLFLSSAAASRKITHRISKFAFRNQDNRCISSKTVDGKVHVANFFFSSCGSICPVMMKNMTLVQQAFEGQDNVQLLSYTATPWIDSVPALKKYAFRNGIRSPNWHLLTGRKSAIYTLARKSYFAEEDLGYSKDSTQFLHTEHLILVDQQQRIRGIYNGTLELEARQLIKDIAVLLGK